MKVVGFLVLIHLTGTTPYYVLSEKTVKEGEDIVIDCSLMANYGVYWFFQSENSKPQFLLYISTTGKVTNSKPNSRLDSKRSSKRVSLTVKGFSKSDSGKYYCVMMQNMALEFGNMVARYLEEVKSTPKATTTLTSTRATASPTTKETTPCTPTKSALKEACHILIWAPLTGAASLLFLALVFVSIAYCKRPRRKRCQHQYRKRPIPEDVRRPLNNYH